MNQEGIFISYQMAEAIELIERYDLNNPEDVVKGQEELGVLKNKWLNDTLPGTDVKIGGSFAGMQDITVEEVVKVSELAKNVDTYTVENAGAFQHILYVNGEGEYDFDFNKLDIIADLARKNGKKIIIDSAVVFGDYYPTKLQNLNKEQITALISSYTRRLVERYGDIIERIDVLNSVYKRQQISPENNSEDFWKDRFGENYGQDIIGIVRDNLGPEHSDIQLGWNEFYLTNSKYEQRRKDFLSTTSSIDGLDVVGVHDRFMSGENLDYITQSLDEITSVSKNSGKKVCLTEFSCSASGVDLERGDTALIDTNIQNILQGVGTYCASNDTIARVEGRISDKFDFNHKELQGKGFDISTTGRKNVSSEVLFYGQVPKVPFAERSQIEIQTYESIKAKNKVIKQSKEQAKVQEDVRVKKLLPPTPNRNPINNGGYSNSMMLFIITIVALGALIAIAFWLLGK